MGLQSAILASLAAVCLATSLAAEKQGPRVYRDHVTPHWFANNSKFWYQNDLPGNGTEIVVIDAATGTREKVEKAPVEESEGDLRTQSESHPSGRSDVETRITFQNKRAHSIELFWIDQEGERKSYGKVEAGERRELHTFEGHVWLVTSEKGTSLGVFEAGKNPAAAVIDESMPNVASKTQPERRRRSNGNGTETSSDHSPDGAWQALVKDHNVIIKSLKSDDEISATMELKRWVTDDYRGHRTRKQ